MQLLALLPLFSLGGCTALVEGKVIGEVPKGAQVVALWPSDNALGKVAGVADISAKGTFELRAAQPDNQHTGLEFASLVLYDGNPAKNSILALNKFDLIVGAAPRHYVVDSNSSCSVGDGCNTDGGFDRGITCGECKQNGTCKAVECAKLEVVATELPLSLDWAIPDVDPIPAVYTEAGQHVAFVPEDDSTVELFGIGQTGGPIFRTDGRVDAILGVHWETQRVAVRSRDAVGVEKGHVRDFSGFKFLELTTPGNPLYAGPVLSPDGSLAAAVTRDEGLAIYDIDDGGALIASQQVANTDVSLHWSPEGGVVYAVGAEGSTPDALALLGFVPTDWPECLDGPQTASAQPCFEDRGAGVDYTLTHPILIPTVCATGDFATLPRSLSPVAVRACFADPTTTTTTAGSAR